MIHYSNSKLLTRKGDWEKQTIVGMWGLFTFHLLKIAQDKSGEISYTLPIAKDGTYQNVPTGILALLAQRLGLEFT